MDASETAIEFVSEQLRTIRSEKGKSIIALPTDYVVIDTETTGLDFDFCDIIEVCAIRYSDGQRVDCFSTLVQPCQCVDLEGNTFYVNSFITNLTGITNDMLAVAPSPDDILPALRDFIGDSVLIGHNVNFDVNFLYDSFKYHIGHAFSNDYIDTLRIARKFFPELAHHRLSDVAAACKISQPQAHRAEADCIVTAQCYEVMRSAILGRETEYDFCNRFRKHKKRPASFKNYSQLLAEMSATNDDIDDTNPIFGKVVVFTGTLSKMTRKDAFQFVLNLGGIPDDSITKKTNYLVIGSFEFASSVKNGKTKKMQKAESLLLSGFEISILSEGAFFDLFA